jgi:tripartite-type tricarboxylate transporter receptor subunit TctC
MYDGGGLGKLAFSLLLLAVGIGAGADHYPSKPIRIVVPWPPGQATDLVMRDLADQLSRTFGQSMIVDNRAGAGGRIGTEVVTKAAADRYTLLGGSSGPVTIGPLVHEVPYDVEKQLVAVHCVSLSAFVLVAQASFPAKSAAQFIALMKASPGHYTFASSGIGSTSHLLGEYFASAAEIDVRHIPFKGSVPALGDVIGGQVSFAFDTAGATLPFIRSGKLKAYGISTLARVPALPDVAPLGEQPGLTGWDMGAWTALMAPAGTPREIVDQLSNAVGTILNTPATQERFSVLGLNVLSKPAAQCAAYLKAERQRFATLIQAKGIHLDE